MAEKHRLPLRLRRELRPAVASVDREGPDRELRDHELVLLAHAALDGVAAALDPQVVVDRDLTPVEGRLLLERVAVVRLQRKRAAEPVELRTALRGAIALD